MSSSVPEKKTFRSFLATSFELLRREKPDVYDLMCQRLGSRRVVLEVDRESVALGFSARQVRFVEAPEHPEVRVVTSKRGVLRVIDAETSLMEAVLSNELQILAKLDDLVAFHEGLMAYVHAAVRAPSFPRLLSEYRQAADSAERDPDLAA